MFELLTSSKYLDLSKILKWNIDELANNHDVNCQDVYNFYKNNLRMKAVHFTQYPVNYSMCEACNFQMPNRLLTKIEGTYKYTHCKFRTQTYQLCPICLKLSADNKKYANLVSERTTYDEQGILMNRPSRLPGYTKYFDSESNWVIVHPQLRNRNDASDMCGCDFGCYMCSIEPRFTLENN
jgi:hypothetical protein